jgi:hypothetical protein
MASERHAPGCSARQCSTDRGRLAIYDPCRYQKNSKSQSTAKVKQHRRPRRLTAIAAGATKNTWLLGKDGAGGGTRTRTEVTLQRILSPLCLPFHHPGRSRAVHARIFATNPPPTQALPFPRDSAEGPPPAVNGGRLACVYSNQRKSRRRPRRGHWREVPAPDALGRDRREGASLRQMTRFAISCAALGVIATVAGCAVAEAPLKTTSQIVATPQPGALDVSSQPSALIGDVQPVYVSIANGTDTPRSVVPSQIFALNAAGNRVAPLPAGEAARQAGGAGELKAALVSGATSGVLGAGVGAGLGAITGSLLHSGATGAVLGAALGGGQAGIQGAMAGQQKADQQASTQLNALALQQTDVRRNFTVSGYVFFPKGDYKQLQLVLVDGESGDTEVVSRPW